jgi:hypothetical protein
MYDMQFDEDKYVSALFSYAEDNKRHSVMLNRLPTRAEGLARQMECAVDVVTSTTSRASLRASATRPSARCGRSIDGRDVLNEIDPRFAAEHRQPHPAGADRERSIPRLRQYRSEGRPLQGARRIRTRT